MINILKLFWTFFKIGLFTFGGGYAMIPMIIEETSKFAGIEKSDIIDFIAISESTPGPFAVNIATFIGYQQEGIIGAIFTTLGVILPSFLIILIILKIIEKIKENKYFKSIIKTVMPVVLGLIISSILDVSLTSLFDISSFNNIKDDFSPNLTSIISLILISITLSTMYLWKKKKLAPIYIILICASFGISISYLLI